MAFAKLTFVENVLVRLWWSMGSMFCLMLNCKNYLTFFSIYSHLLRSRSNILEFQQLFFAPQMNAPNIIRLERKIA